MKKDIFKSVMLALCMLVSFYANAHDFEVDGIYYNILTTTEVEVTFKGSYYYEYYDEYTGKVEIPESISYDGSTYSVTSIGEYAFEDCKGLKIVINFSSLNISAGSDGHGDVAYYADKVITADEQIGDFYFMNMELAAYTGNDKEVKLPDNYNGGNYTIGYAAFSGCTGLASITIPNSVTSIGDSAFEGCKGLTSITIPNSVTSIGGGAFEDCTGLTSITIPNSVTSTGWYAFEGCTGLASVTIPNSVTSIGTGAFKGCTGLTSITIPNSVTSIEGQAFMDCTGLTSITIPNSVTSIETGAFSDCTGLASITIPNSVTSIETGAFSDCTGLASITVDDGNAVYDSRENCNAIIEKETNGLILGCKNTVIPNSVTSIEGSAFHGCTGLTSITIPNSVTSIETGAFSDCTGLASITVDDGNAVYDSRENCNAIIEKETNSLILGCKNTTIPNSVTSIGWGAFEDCTGLTSITIPNSVTSIGYYAFYGCTGLTSITIPNSVTSIGYSAFKGCTGLKIVINFSSLNISAGSFDPGYVAYYADKVITADEQIGDFIFKDMELVAYTGNDKEVKLPNNYKGGNYTIGEFAFKGCTGLASITIPNSVTSIRFSAFKGCTGLTSITIPNSVTSIEWGAFFGCSGLTSITIPNSVTSIGDYAFLDCTGLTSITIPNSVTSIEWGAFFGCTGLTSIAIPNSVTSIGYEAFRGCTGLTSITIPNSVTSIGKYAFKGCTGLTSIAIPNSVTSIGEWAFYRCEGLTSINIPNSVTSIGGFAFEGCTGLTNITIPNSPTSIGNCAFWGCTGLTSITIPNSVTSIGNGAFYGCEGLKTVINFSSLNISAGSDGHGYVAYYADKVITADEQIGDFNFMNMELAAYTGNDKDVKLPDNYNGGNYTIGYAAFSGCTGLASITIPNSVTSIGVGAFFGCTGLTSIAIPNSVTSIGDEAFRGCTGLTSITIPNSVTSIGEYAFKGCTGLTSITIPNSVTSIGGFAFEGCTGLTSVTIPNSVTSIGDYAFRGCKELTSITIPNSVTSIEWGAFEDCTGLKTVINCSSLDISAGSWNHGYVAYYADKVITADEQIGDFIFKDMELVAYTGNDKEVKLPNNYNGGNYTIGEFAFFGCTGLASITIPNSVTSIGVGAFSGCSGLTSITIPNSVTSIGYGAFYGCTGLTSIAIPNSVTSIRDYAFTDCEGLASITIPNSVTSIGYSAFEGCNSLSEIYSYMENPCVCPSFGSSPTLYVPAGTAGKYIEQHWDYYVSEIVEVEIEISSTLAVSDVKVTHGASVILPVSMENEESVTAFQFEVSLPEGVSLVGCELTDRKSDQTLSFSELPNGNYQVAAISLTSKAFKDSEGALVNLQLATEKEMEAGEYDVTVKNIELTTTDEDALRPANCTAKLTVTDVMVGDSNGDGKISITDAVAIVNYILSKPSSSFAVEAADVNMDAKVTITDAVAIVNKILAGTNEVRSRAADMQLDPQ